MNPWTASHNRACALFLLCCISYLPALSSFYVKDDIALLTSANFSIKNALWHSWPGGFFRPSSELLLSVQYSIFGLSPIPYHIVSLAAHIGTCFFVHRLFNLLPKYRSSSFLATAIFALHPLNTESVSWISGQILCTRKSPAASTLTCTIGLGFYENFLLVPVLWITISATYRPLLNSLRPLSLLPIVMISGIYAYWRFSILGLGGGYYNVDLSIKTSAINGLYYLYLLMGGSAIGGRIIHYAPDTIHLNFLTVFPPLLLANLAIFLAFIQRKKNKLMPRDRED